jgi:hypothetical protein
MGFRRSAGEEQGSSRWRTTHRARLLACGIPAGILESDRRLTYVLLHGEELETGWDTSFLSDEQAQRLLALLKEQIPNPVGFDLIAALVRAASWRRTGNRMGYVVPLG